MAFAAGRAVLKGKNNWAKDIAPGVWAFDQMIGIYYVHVPIG